MSVVVSVVLVLAAAPDDPASSESKCGGYCLFVALKALDLVDEPYSRFEKNLPPPGPSGYSIHDLEQLAEARGAKTLALEADAETLSRLSGRRACVVLMGNHFVLLKSVDVGRDRVSVIDPPYDYDQTLEEFQARFSNRSLVVSRDPIATPSAGSGWTLAIALSSLVAAALCALTVLWRMRSRAAPTASLCLFLGCLVAAGCDGARPSQSQAGGPSPSIARPRRGLRIEPVEHHAGRVVQLSPDQKIERSTLLFNDGKATIQVLEARRTCACTSVSLDKWMIPPGDHAMLTASFRMGGRPGPNRVAVELFTSSPGDAGARITYDWDLVTPLFIEPAECRLGRVEPAKPATTALALLNRGLVLCEDCRVEVRAESSFLSARFQGDPLAKRRADPSHSGSGLDQESRLGDLLLETSTKADSGDHAQVVEICLRCRGIDRAKLSLPVSWSIRPPVELHPGRLWRGGASPSGKLESRVLVRSNDDSLLRVVSATVKSGAVQVRADFTASAEIEKAIDLTVAAPKSEGIHRGVLEILMEGKTKTRLSLPISLVVRGVKGSGDR